MTLQHNLDDATVNSVVKLNLPIPIPLEGVRGAWGHHLPRAHTQVITALTTNCLKEYEKLLQYSVDNLMIWGRPILTNFTK